MGGGKYYVVGNKAKPTSFQTSEITVPYTVNTAKIAVVFEITRDVHCSISLIYDSANFSFDSFSSAIILLFLQ